MACVLLSLHWMALSGNLLVASGLLLLRSYFRKRYIIGIILSPLEINLQFFLFSVNVDA